MKDAIITLLWVTATFAVIAIPVINMALLTASLSILVGMVVGLVMSTLLGRFTIFEEEVGWIIGLCSSVVCSFYVWNSLPAVIQSL